VNGDKKQTCVGEGRLFKRLIKRRSRDAPLQSSTIPVLIREIEVAADDDRWNSFPGSCR